MTCGTDYQKYWRLQAKLEQEISKAKERNGLQEMPDEVWADEERRMDWIKTDREQWDYNNSRLAELQRLYDKCFPKKEWVNSEIESFFRSEEGPIF